MLNKTIRPERVIQFGKGGFVFLPCELIKKNGETLKKYTLLTMLIYGV